MEIPIIEPEPEKRGYWAIYPNRKVWRNDLPPKKMKFKDYDKSEKKYGIAGGGDWLTLQQGDNRIRIVSEFEDYGSHYDSTQKKSFVCLGEEECPFCQNGEKPRVQYLGWVIDRKDNEIKLLQIGHQVFKQIGEYAKSDEYGFEKVPSYDMNIKKTGQGLNTEYAVLASRKDAELSEEEKAMITEKIKLPKEILENMKAKQKGQEANSQTSESEESQIPEIEESEDIDPKDIPF